MRLEVYSFYIYTGFHEASYFNTLGSCGVSELRGKMMIGASDVSSAILNILSTKSVFNRVVIVVHNVCGL